MTIREEMKELGESSSDLKILLFDIETAPSMAYVWRLFKENIPLQRLVDSGYMLCWAAKWYGQKTVHFRSVNDADMHAKLHEMINEADVLVHYNGNSFDVPIVNAEFILHGFDPPAPSVNVDLYRTVRKKFKFTSGKLDHVTRILGLSGKLQHSGFDVWVGCMANDAKAWREMKRYNKQDVVVLEELYDALLPWIDAHPNHNLYSGTVDACTNCGREDTLTRQGHAYTATRKYQRYLCMPSKGGCGKWIRDSKSVPLSGVDVQGLRG